MLMLVCMNHTLAIKFCLNKNESSFFQQSKLGTYYGLKADDAGGNKKGEQTSLFVGDSPSFA